MEFISINRANFGPIQRRLRSCSSDATFLRSGCSNRTRNYICISLIQKAAIDTSPAPPVPYGFTEVAKFEKALEIASRGSAPLHGDLTLSNVYRKQSKHDIVGDPQDAVVGHPAVELGDVIANQNLLAGAEQFVPDFVNRCSLELGMDATRVALGAAGRLLSNTANFVQQERGIDEQTRERTANRMSIAKALLS